MAATLPFGLMSRMTARFLSFYPTIFAHAMDDSIMVADLLEGGLAAFLNVHLPSHVASELASLQNALDVV